MDSASGISRYFRTSNHWFPSVVRYGSVGGFVLCIDLAVFAAMLHLDVAPVPAGAIAGLVAALIHFFLTKFFSFRERTRSVGRQAIVYSVLGGLWWLLTLGIIGIGTAVFHLNPMVAKLIAVAINFPLGFIAHKTLTFGTGIDALLAAAARRPSTEEPRPSV